MSSRKINDLPKISHKDVEPHFTKEELKDRLASAVHYLRESGGSGEQAVPLEFMYSLIMSLDNN